MPDKAIDNKNKKRGLKVAALAGGLVLVGGVAFAYWTQAGGGTGTVTTGTTTNDLVVSQTAPTGAVAPGVDVSLSGTVSNSNDATVHVASVTAEVTDVTPVGTNICDTDNYAITGTSTVNADIAHSASAPWSGLTLSFVENGQDQNGCKGASVEITYTTH